MSSLPPVLPGVVAEAARRFGDRRAVVAPAGWSLTYTDLHRLSEEAAAGLAAAGTGDGDVAALLIPSSPDYLVAYLAAARLGAATAGVNPRAAPAERTRALATIGPDVVVGTPSLLDGVDTGDARVHTVTLAEGAEGVLAALRKPGGAPRGRGVAR